MGGLNQNLELRSHGNHKVHPCKAEQCFHGWLPSISFLVHPHVYGSPNHSGKIRVNWIILIKFGGYLARERCILACLCPFQDVHLWKETIVLGSPSILVMPISRLHIVLDQLKGSNTITHTCDNIWTPFLLSLLVLAIVAMLIKILSIDNAARRFV